MKADIIAPATKPAFKPFTIKLTVETEKEAHALWHRLNAGELHPDYTRTYKLDIGNTSNDKTMRLWKVLDTELEAQGSVPSPRS